MEGEVMATYNVMLLQAMSRVTTVEADSEERAREIAEDEGDFNVNISNNFEESGEVEAYKVTKVSD
jgi:hypothetical protein